MMLRVEFLTFSDGFKIGLTNMMFGSDLDDVLEGTNESDTIWARDGDDMMFGRNGDDYLDGGNGHDVIFGESGNDIINGSLNDDYLDGGAGDDVLYDGFGNDRLFGNIGADQFIISQNKGDVDLITDFDVNEDVLDLSLFGSHFINLKQMNAFYATIGQLGADTHITFSNTQQLSLEGVDMLGLSAQNIWFDLDDVDGLVGSDANDRLFGTELDDVIIDGCGLDMMTGGDGQDTFVITKHDHNADIDTITDFTHGQDLIDLRLFDDYVHISQLDIQQLDEDSILTFNNGQRLILDNVQTDMLSNDDFMFNVFNGIGEFKRFCGDVNYDFGLDQLSEIEKIAPETSLSVQFDHNGYVISPLIQDSSVINYDDVSLGNLAEISQISENHIGTNYGQTNFDTVANAFNQGVRVSLSNDEYRVSRQSGKQRVSYTMRDDVFDGNNSGSGTGKMRFRRYGNHGNESFDGGWWNEIIKAGSGHDKVYGNNGNDTIYAGSGNDYVDGGHNHDKIYGQNGHDRLLGGYGNDTILGGRHNDYLDGGSGHDRLSGGHHQDYLNGGSGDDCLYGDNGNDILYGGSGHDYLHGGHHNDFLNGGIGNDSLYGGVGHDQLVGGSGHDSLNGSSGHDQLIGGNGNDSIDGGLIMTMPMGVMVMIPFMGDPEMIGWMVILVVTYCLEAWVMMV